MKRASFAVAATTFAVLGIAGPAQAAPAQVTQIRFSGSEVEASWRVDSGTTQIDTTVMAIQSKRSPELYVARMVFDDSGITETTADVTSGYAFAIDLPHLGDATLTATALPAETCTYDSEYNQIGCDATTVDVSVAWNATSPVTHTVVTDRFQGPGVLLTDHYNGKTRAATASGTYNGSPLTSDDPGSADLAIVKQGFTQVCLGGTC